MKLTIMSIKSEINRLAGDCAGNQEELLRLCGKHPKAEGAIRVVINEEVKGAIGGIGLKFEYRDGRFETFSKETAAKYYLGKPVVENHRANMMTALRNEVHDQSLFFRASKGYTGMGSEFHVDHTVKFRDIAKQWLEMNPNVEYEWRRERFTFKQFFIKDPEQASSWRQFHRDKAVLRMLTAEENLRIG